MRVRLRFRSAAGDIDVAVRGEMGLWAGPNDQRGLTLQVSTGRLRLEVSGGPLEARELLRALRAAEALRRGATGARSALPAIRATPPSGR